MQEETKAIAQSWSVKKIVLVSLGVLILVLSLIFAIPLFIILVSVGLIVYFTIQAEAKNKELESQLTGTLVNKGFTVTKSFIRWYPHFYIDDVNKKWTVVDNKNEGNKIIESSAMPKVYDYKDILAFEVYEDGNSVMKGKTGSAIVGGLAFGVVGALVGGAGSRKSTNMCNTLQVRITINDIINPQIIFGFIATPTKKDGIIYKNVIDNAKAMIATFTYMQNKATETA